MSFFDDLVGGIGSIASKVLPVAAPIIGGAFGGPIGAALGGVAGGFLGRAFGGATAIGPQLPAPSIMAPPSSFLPSPLLNVGRTALPTTIPLTGTRFSLGGPYGLNFSSGGSGSGGRTFTPPAGYGAGNVATAGQFRSMLLQQASAAAGFRVTWKKLLYMLLHFGLEVVKRLTQLDESAILWLYTTRPHRGRRGPHLNTIARRARQVQSYRHRVARIAHIIGAVRHHRAPAALPARRRRRR